MSDHIRKAFAGANTGDGFISFYDLLFREEELSSLYIIKGGPGTGNSSFIKRFGDIASSKGYFCEYFLCGSDPGSFDGILVSNGVKKIGIIDGTPPHPKELKSPGAAGEILNFGKFWSGEALRNIRGDIDRINKEKHTAFETAYRYLGAANKIDRHITHVLQDIYLHDKAYRVAEKLVLSAGVSGELLFRQLKSYTMKGLVDLIPSDSVSQEIFLSGNDEIGKLFLGDIILAAQKNHMSALVSRSPIDFSKADSVYFPESKVYIHIGESEDPNRKSVNMRRFIDSNVMKQHRQKIKFGKKCRGSLIKGAIDSLATASEHHFKLESLYSEYMDYKSLTEQSSIWYGDILSTLD